MLAGVEGAGSVIIQQPLLQFHPVGFSRWEWDFGGLGWWCFASLAGAR